MTVTVIGLGKIGLPLAVQYARSGERVIGADVSARVVDLVNAGTEPFPGEDHLAEYLSAEVAAGRLTATTDTADAVAHSDVVVVVVPLFVDENDAPDFGWMDSATNDIGRGLRAGTLVIYETTLPVGTTRDRWKPRLEALSGLSEGDDFHLAFSPERVLTGRVFADLRKYPKLVGGLTEAGSKQAIAFYERVLQFDDRPDLRRGNGVWDLGSAEAAEMAKLAETTYRDVNIGLANQFAVFADRAGINVYDVIEASNSQPYSHIHQPGIAVGGHCIPVYPRLYLHGDEQATIVRTARAQNTAMPEYCVRLAEQSYGNLRGARVVILGATYRGGVKEVAYSGVFPLVRVLNERGAHVTVHDAILTESELSGLGLSAHRIGTYTDVAFVQADHPEYSSLTESDLPGVAVIVDGRGVIRRESFPASILVRPGDIGSAANAISHCLTQTPGSRPPG